MQIVLCLQSIMVCLPTEQSTAVPIWPVCRTVVWNSIYCPTRSKQKKVNMFNYF